MKLLVDDIVGEIKSPITTYGGVTQAQGGGLILFLTNILRIIFIAAGIFAFFNIIGAGFGFMTAGGDSKKITQAWDKMWQSLLGLVLIVGSFALAALFGQLVFGDPKFILSPQIFGPGQ